MGVISYLGSEPGKPSINLSVCNLCGTCAEICPTGVLIRTEKEIRVDQSQTFGCIACAQCAMACPKEAIEVTGRGTSTKDDLVPLPAVETQASFAQLEALSLHRRSIRHFKDTPVSRELLDRIISMAATAPMGVPPFETGITVLETREKVESLAGDVAEIYGKLLKFVGMPFVWKILRLFLKKSMVEQIESFILPLARSIVDERAKGRDAVFYSAPAVLIFHKSRYADPSDAAIVATYAMLAAQSLGLGSCMIGCATPVMDKKKGLLNRLGVPKGQAPTLALIVGYPRYTYRRGIKRHFREAPKDSL